MTPTNELRFVEREVRETVSVMPTAYLSRTVRILQQKWVDETCVLRVYQHGDGPLQREYLHAWRDVEVVKETQ